MLGPQKSTTWHQSNYNGSTTAVATAAHAALMCQQLMVAASAGCNSKHQHSQLVTPCQEGPPNGAANSQHMSIKSHQSHPRPTNTSLPACLPASSAAHEWLQVGGCVGRRQLVSTGHAQLLRGGRCIQVEPTCRDSSSSRSR